MNKEVLGTPLPKKREREGDPTIGKSIFLGSLDHKGVEGGVWPISKWYQYKN